MKMTEIGPRMKGAASLNPSLAPPMETKFCTQFAQLCTSHWPPVIYSRYTPKYKDDITRSFQDVA